jgi:O-antigen/teichoic acid export membrane protein
MTSEAGEQTHAGGEPELDVLATPEAGGMAIRGGAIRTAGFIGGSLLTLISAPLLVRHLGTAGFGRYQTIISLIALVSGITDVGLTAVAVREYTVRSGAARDAFMRTILGARLGLATAGVVCATAFSAIAGYGHGLVLGTALAGAGLVLGIAQANYAVPLAAELRLGWVTIIDLVRAGASVVLVVVLILAGAGVVSFLALTIPVGIVVLAVNVALVRGRVPLVPSFHLAAMRPLLRETLPLAVAVIVYTLYFRVVLIIMSLIAAELQTGYFAVSDRLMEVLIGIPALLVGSTFPILSRAAHGDHDRLAYVLGRLVDVALIGGVWMTLACALGAGFAIEVVGGHEAAPAAPVMRIECIVLALLFLTVTWQNVLIALRAHRPLLVVNAGALVVLVALSFALVPSHDAKGAAVAVVIGEAVLMISSAAVLFGAHPHLRPRLQVLPRVALAALLAGGAALALPAGDVPRVILATLVYFGVLVLLRAIPWEIRTALLGQDDSGPPAPPASNAAI